MILLAACPVHAAGEAEDVKWLGLFDTESKAKSTFKDGSGNYITTINNDDNTVVGLDVTKLSNYSVRWANPQAGANNFQLSGPIDVTGYKYLNFWFFAKGDFSTRIYLNASSGNVIHGVGLYRGWNLVSIPLKSGMTSVTDIKFHVGTLSATIPTGLPNAGSTYTAQSIHYPAGTSIYRHYMDSMWLSKTQPINEFSSINVAEGSRLVLPTIGTVSIKAPGLLASSVNVNNIEISYCAEGTHDENSHSDVPLTAGTDYTASWAKDTLKINFANDLIPGTSYKIKVKGATDYIATVPVGTGYDAGTTYHQTSASADFAGNLEMPFNDFTLNFRTKGLDENFPPEVTLLSPSSGERYYPGDNISIKAQASDADGTITKVEFYADDAKIGEDSVPSDGIYEFLWENVPEKMSGYEIKAKAIDDKSAETLTIPVNISVMGIKDPLVTFAKPAENINIVRNFSGITTSTDVEAEVNVTCYGATVVKAEFLLNGDVVSTDTEAKETYTYTYANLPIGNHTLSVMVTDTEGSVGVSETRTVNVCDYGKKLPALAEYNFEDAPDGSETDWTKGGTASFTVETKAQNNALKIETVNPASAESVSVQKRYRTSLSATPWEITAKIMLGDTLHDRTYTLSGSAEDASITFKAGGDITVGGTKKGTYKENEWIEVRYIVNPDTNTSYCLINDVKVYEKTGLSTVFSSNGATIKLSQTGIPGKTGWCKIDDVAVCKLFETELGVTDIKVCSSQGADLGDSAVTSDASYISVSLNETLNNESIKNNIVVTDTSTNNRISLIYKDGKAYFNEVLKSNTIYNVLVTTSVSSQNGTSLAKSVSHSFTTAKGDVELSNIDFSESALSAGVISVTFNFELDNNASEPKTVYAVAVLYDGGKQKALSVKKVDLASSVQDVASSVTVPVTYTNDTFIEVYFVDDMQTMNPISNTIYKLK